MGPPAAEEMVEGPREMEAEVEIRFRVIEGGMEAGTQVAGGGNLGRGHLGGGDHPT